MLIVLIQEAVNRIPLPTFQLKEHLVEHNKYWGVIWPALQVQALSLHEVIKKSTA